jgi:hypothetical protein
MKEYSVILNENEFKLFQLIQRVNTYPEIKNDLLESFMKQVKNFLAVNNPVKVQSFARHSEELQNPSQKNLQQDNFSQLTSHKKSQKWLQIGDRTLFENINPVSVEENSPLASDIITQQRKRINVEE